jgi:hypothetical protein
LIEALTERYVAKCRAGLPRVSIGVLGYLFLVGSITGC